MDEEPDGRDANPEEDDIDDPEPTVTTSRESLDSEVRSWPLQKLSSGDPDPPRAVEAIGQLGIYLGVVAIALAIVGLAAGTLEFQPLARVAIFFAIVLASVAMGLGVVFQVFVIRQ